MSAFGTKIFDNDMALDVKSDFDDLYSLNKSIEEIHQYIFSYCPDDTDEEACAFWTGLACIEWEYGVLCDFIRDKAIEIALHHNDVELFIYKDYRTKRQEALDCFIEKIKTVNPKPKKRKRTSFVYKCQWKEGDVLAYPVKDKYAFIHIYGILKHEHTFEELSYDSISVKVFDYLLDNIPDIEFFKDCNKYLRLDIDEYRATELERIWCDGKREKDKFDKSVKIVGNIPVNTMHSYCVCAAYQFNKLEDSLYKRFNNKYLTPKYKDTWDE